MKTNIYLSTLAIFSAFSIEAQVTLTQSNHAPVIGDNNPRRQADTINSIIPTLNITGNGVTWDFTNKLASNTNTLVNVFVDPTTLAGSSIYIAAGCNVALQDSDFYKSSSTKLEYLGDISPDGEIFDLTPNPVTFMQYPFSYGSSFTDVTSGTMTFPGGSFNLTGTINVVADGQGTLILPSNPTIVHNNVLRVKSTSTLLIQGTGSLSTVTGTQTMTEYEYYISGQKFPVLWIQYEKLNIPALNVNDFEVEIDHPINYVLGVNNSFISNNTNALLYPNPTQNSINIELNDQETYTLSILSIDGRMMYQTKFQQKLSIPCESWEKGIYILNITHPSLPEKNQSIKFLKD